MTMVLDGNGSITGLVAGGLPDATVTAADIVDASITAAKLSGAQTGSAPIYGCRAWCCFNGSSGAILANGNIASVTRNSAGNYTVVLSTPMIDNSYAVTATPNGGGFILYIGSKTVTQFTLTCYISTSGVAADCSYADFAIFR